MGVVKMKEQTDFIHRGYPHGRATLYIYCDKCGSFNIERYDSVNWLLIVVACGFVAGAALLIFQSKHRISLGMLFLCLFAAICFFVYGCLSGETHYKCRKCGNGTSIDYNTLDYPSDSGIVDVPDQLTQKRYLGYWPDEYNIDYALKQPEASEHENGNALLPE